MLKYLFLFVIIFLSLTYTAAALSLELSGGCVNEKVTVFTDEEAVIIFRINSGTPFFASSSPTSPATFLPRVTGVLTVTAISGEENVTKSIEVVECGRTSEGRSSGSAVRNVLPSGTFKVLGVEVSWRTAYGALQKAAEIEGFSVTPKLTDWGIFVECIRGTCSGELGETSGWMYWVNYPSEPLPGVAATEYRVKPGDEVVWYFSRGMNEKPETSPYKIIIKLGGSYELYVNVIWQRKVQPYADFTFTPSSPKVMDRVVFDASKSFDDGEIVSYLWDFGDGSTAFGKVVEHSFSKPGNYTVKLTVIDDEGMSASATKVVIVGDVVLQLNRSFVLEAGGAVKVKIPDEWLLLTSIEIGERSEPVELFISQSPVPPELLYGTIQSCFNLSINKSVDVKINFKLPKEVVDGEVVLMKYNGSWTEIPTEKVGEDSSYVYFTSRVKEFSTFAIVVKWEKFPIKSSDERILKALNWLRSQQNSDGGFGEPGENSSIAKTSWVIVAIAAAGENPHEWKKNGRSPVDYLRENIGEQIKAMGTAEYARTILAIISAGENPRNFAGLDMVSMLKSRLKENGQIGDFVYTTIWGIIALAAAGEDVKVSANWLKAQQNSDGGFSWNSGEESDYDDTSAAIQALIAAGEPKDSEAILRALEFLKSGQNEDGGMRYFGSSASNSASDAWTIQALVAAGRNPERWVNNRSVVEHLLSLQTEEGYFKYTAHQTSNPVYMTACSILALLGKPHPVKVELSLMGNASSEVTVPTTITTPTLSETQTATTTTHSAHPSAPEVPSFTVIAALMAVIVACRLRGV